MAQVKGPSVLHHVVMPMIVMGKRGRRDRHRESNANTYDIFFMCFSPGSVQLNWNQGIEVFSPFRVAPNYSGEARLTTRGRGFDATALMCKMRV
jgi:hypothetical protein